MLATCTYTWTRRFSLPVSAALIVDRIRSWCRFASSNFYNAEFDAEFLVHITCLAMAPATLVLLRI